MRVFGVELLSMRIPLNSLVYQVPTVPIEVYRIRANTRRCHTVNLFFYSSVAKAKVLVTIGEQQLECWVPAQGDLFLPLVLHPGEIDIPISVSESRTGIDLVGYVELSW